MSRHTNRIFLHHITNVVSSTICPDCLIFEILSYGLWSLEMNFWPSGGKYLQSPPRNIFTTARSKKGGNCRKRNQNPNFWLEVPPICNTAVNANIDAKYVQRVERNFKTYPQFKCNMS